MGYQTPYDRELAESMRRNRPKAALDEVRERGYSVKVGDAVERLAELPENALHLAFTSPPYYQLRSYATDEASKSKELGSEATVAEFVANLVRVGEGVRRALRPDGLFFVNLGDTYNQVGGGRKYGSSDGGTGRADTPGAASRSSAGSKPKDLLGVPWSVAFAMRDAGWYLRKEIIWAKPNPMPESVMDRPTSAHEHVFMFAKSERNFWDKEAVREKGAIAAGTLGAKGSAERAATPGVNARPPEYKVYDGRRNLRDVWWIQTRPFKGSHFATFPAELVAPAILGGTSAAGVCAACGAPWRRVTELVGIVRTGGNFGDPMRTTNALSRGDLKVQGIPIRETLAWDPGCGPSKPCDRCKGEGVIEVPDDLPILGPAQGGLAEDWPEEDSPDLREKKEAAAALAAKKIARAGDAIEDGFEECPRCMGYGEIRSGCTAEKPVPAIVLDPFLGSGTTVVEALRLGRHGIGFDLSAEYVAKYALPAVQAAARQPTLLGMG